MKRSEMAIPPSPTSAPDDSLRTRYVRGLCYLRRVAGHAVFHDYSCRCILGNLSLQRVSHPTVVDQKRISKEPTQCMNVRSRTATDRVLLDRSLDRVVVRRS